MKKNIQNSSKYILAIVGIVAVVGIVVLILGGKSSAVPFSTSSTESDEVGYATISNPQIFCRDTDGGFDYREQGTISGGKWLTTEKRYSAHTDTCNDVENLEEYFCYDRMHGYYSTQSCDDVIGAGYSCSDGACSRSVAICDELYLDGSISNCNPSIDSTDLSDLADGTYIDTVGATENTVGYTQELQFYDEDTGIFLFAQDDDDAPEVNMYLFIDNGNNYFYRYVLAFDGLVYYDAASVVSAETDLVGTEIRMVGETYTIIGIGYETSTGAIIGLTLEKSDGTELMIDGNDVFVNGVEVEGSYAEIDSSPGNLDAIIVSYAPDPDEEYLRERGSLEDPIFGLVFTLSSIEEDNYEEIMLSVSSVSGLLSFTNNDGTFVQLPVAADSSYTSGEASNEVIFWGNEAPSSTVKNQDELLYLEGEFCQGSTSVVDCQGALFLVIDDDSNAHLVQITNLDSTDDTITFEDLTYGESTEDMPYTESSLTMFSLGSAGDIEFEINEEETAITFITIGSADGATITTENRATLEIVNKDLSLQTYEGLLFSEFNDGRDPLYFENFEIGAIFDDRTDNRIEYSSSSTFSTSQGYGPFDLSATNDDVQEFMTWKGTKISYDREDQSYIRFEHPENSVYAVVELE